MSSDDILVSPTATVSLDKLGSEAAATNDVGVSRAGRLIDKYPQAYSDFYPSCTPCVYKSGPAWKVRTGPQAQRIVREARPVYRPDIAPVWLSILHRIYEHLDFVGVDWTSINPIAYADEGEAAPFCPFLIYVGVMPYSLAYEGAVTAAAGVKEILAESGLVDAEVAFVESVVRRSVGGPKLLPFNPLLDELPEYRKHFTPTLGLPIAPLKTPYYEGTGGLYLRLSSNDDRVVLLTCAHVVRPPPAYPANTGMTRTNNSAPRELIVALGNGGFTRAVMGMMAEIGELHTNIEVWKDAIRRLPESAAGENPKVTQRRKVIMHSVEDAMRRINELNEFHTEVTKYRTTAELRVIGHLLHSSPIKVSVEPLRYTEDWALIELHRTQIDWDTFLGNKVYIGGNLSPAKFGQLMFPQPEDRVGYKYPEDGLLQARGVVQAAEIRDPKHLDANGQQCLLVVKNGGATDTTVGRANGLESIKRTSEYGIKETSVEIAVLPYSRERGKFSDRGDSGTMVLTRSGKILGLLTGGAGSIDETDITFVTPYWWLEERIHEKFPDAFLYHILQ